MKSECSLGVSVELSGHDPRAQQASSFVAASASERFRAFMSRKQELDTFCGAYLGLE